VTSRGTGRWGSPHDAVEAVRVASDTRETTFGAPNRLQALPDGGVLVVDPKSLDGLIIRQFDANGKFVRNLGRSGSGPGEYRYQNMSIAPGPKGTIYIRDDMGGSVSVFGPDGKLAESFAPNFNNGHVPDISIAKDGSMYLRAPFNRYSRSPFTDPPQPMLHYDVSGRLLDSISIATRWIPEGAEANEWWFLLPDGRIAFTRRDRFSFLVVNRNGKEPLIVERSEEPVRFLPEERQELQASADLRREKCSRGQPTERTIVPETKNPVDGTTVDIDGRIWISKAMTSQRIAPIKRMLCSGPGVGGTWQSDISYAAPPAFAGFLADGTYLGEVRFPRGAKVSFAGNVAWALVPDADDVMTLVKYRLY